MLWQTQLALVMEQTTRNQVSVNKQVEFWLPIPPVEEQHRIVQLLDGLTTLERQLWGRVRHAKEATKHIPQSILA